MALAVTFTLAATGCSTLKKWSLALSDCVDEPEEVIFGSTDSTALLVIEARILFDPSRALSFSSVLSDILAPADDSADLLKGTIVDESGGIIRGTGIDRFPHDLLFFSNLRPGKYDLASLVAYYRLDPGDKEAYYDSACNTEHVWECPDGLEWQFLAPEVRRDDMCVALAPGDVGYLGTVTLIQDQGPSYGNYTDSASFPCGWSGKVDRDTVTMTESACSILYSPENEIEALTRIAKKYDNDAWMSRCRSRAAEIAAADRSPSP